MPQLLLPLIPDGASQINDRLSVVRENGQWTYFLSTFPVFQHEESDQRSFRMFTAQLVCHGTCKQADLIRTFGISKNSVLRNVQKFREHGIEGFYRPRKTRGPSVLTADVLARVQELLDQRQQPREVAQQLDIKYDTLRKAIKQGRLHPPLPLGVRNQISDKSERTSVDAAAQMGTACTRPEERVLAALGLLNGAPTRFESCHDVSFGGVLCALPALIQNGLLRHVNTCLKSLTGYYTTAQILILLANMALTRIKTVERLQYESPGELGKLLGLDRPIDHGMLEAIRNEIVPRLLQDVPVNPVPRSCRPPRLVPAS